MTNPFSGLTGLAPRSSGSRYVDRPGKWVVKLLSITQGEGGNPNNKATYGIPFVAVRVAIEHTVYETPWADRGQVENKPGEEYSWVRFLDARMPKGKTEYLKDYVKNLQAFQELMLAFTQETPEGLDEEMNAALIADDGAMCVGMLAFLKCTPRADTKGKIDEATGKLVVYHNTFFDPLPHGWEPPAQAGAIEVSEEDISH